MVLGQNTAFFDTKTQCVRANSHAISVDFRGAVVYVVQGLGITWHFEQGEPQIESQSR